MLRPVLALMTATFVLCCLAGCETMDRSSVQPRTGYYAIALHAGAGVIGKDMPEERKRAYFDSLEVALRHGVNMLEQGSSGLDVVEAVIRILEDDPKFNAGKGAVFTHEGAHELDASVMDGKTLACGAITGVRTVKNPITLARSVMEESRHVLFAGEGAERFADQVGVERVDPSYFDTPRRKAALERALERERKSSSAGTLERGTVGVAVLDRAGNLAAGTSTGGMTNKRFGRVGDSPVIGAGTYANNRSCAVSCTGTGEEFIRHTVARDVAALMEYRGWTLEEAAREVVFEKLQPGDGGLIAVDRHGNTAWMFNTPGMFRGAADADGRFQVAIWEDEDPR